MGKILKNIFIYGIEIIIALIIFEFGLKYFLLYAFIMIIIKIDMSVNYLRRLIRVFQMGNECKIISIVKKLEITDENILNVYNETISNLSEKQKKDLDKDFYEITK